MIKREEREMTVTEIRTGAYFEMVGEAECIYNRKVYANRVEIWKRGEEVYAITYYTDGDETAEKLTDEFYSGWCVGGQAAAEYLRIVHSH
jgi:hypothetical protein